MHSPSTLHFRIKKDNRNGKSDFYKQSYKKMSGNVHPCLGVCLAPTIWLTEEIYVSNSLLSERYKNQASENKLERDDSSL